ncbi:hypothetical protein [Streptomyces shaanxiensis]
MYLETVLPGTYPPQDACPECGAPIPRGRRGIIGRGRRPEGLKVEHLRSCSRYTETPNELLGYDTDPDGPEA